MSPTFRVPAQPQLPLYAAGSVVSNTGTWMQRVAQDWLVLQLTGGSGAGPRHHHRPAVPAGAAALAVRRRGRRPVPQAPAAAGHPGHDGRAPRCCSACIAVTGVAEVWHVYVLAFVFGIGAAFDAPARQSFVSEMVEPDDLTNAVGLNSAAFNAARIIGPAVAGLMIGALGGGAGATGWVILINAGSLRRGDLPSSSAWTPPCCTHPGARGAHARGCSSRGSATSAASPR